MGPLVETEGEAQSLWEGQTCLKWERRVWSSLLVCGSGGETELLLEPASGRVPDWRGEMGILSCVWKEK